MNQKKTKDQRVKILLLGESGVGKSSILQRFIDDKFTPNFTTTLGVDYKQKVITTDNQTCIVQVWDTAGQERFNTISSVYYKSVDGVIFVYDVSDRSSFDNISLWIKKLKDNADCDKLDTILVGNKCDSERIVDRDEGEETAKKYGLKFYEASAKTSQNISDIFVALTSLIIERNKKNPILVVDDLELGGVQLQGNQKQEKQKKKRCCG